MRVGFIGAGNMAGAIVRGIVAEGTLPAEDLAVTSAHGRSAQALARETGVDAPGSNEELVERTGPRGVVVLAVKPHLIAEVLEPLGDLLAEQDSLVVSLAAGTPLATLESFLPPGQAVVRVMPNVNALVGAGMAAVCGNASTSEDQVDAVVGLFETVGSAIVLAERDFPAYTAIAGSAPAFAAHFVEALARAAVRNGLPKMLATRIAAQTMLGTARTMLERGTTPAQLADMVSSPGGTTIAGSLAMEDAGFSPAVVRGVQAVIDRDREIAAG
ncbi:pyrroline-5-carboxylate reductase [Georgenia subflava]|uniref:Pyrroline-5-carboxylate reductase n=1 Tax=Georgenia subflava TaxID=1622177 RepID=A0A6N7ES51_9MICO|nr:pyrroline-5-carboxylate reductase [Georgenia subflava]MPV38946.1 pyrroline-5-carboxylate reductase [Georgenia subflava]